jgi:hypothetical protein
LNADLEMAKAKIGVGDKDISEIARQRKRRNRLPLALVGVLTAVASFLVGYGWPAAKEEPSGYPYASLAAAPVIALSGRARYLVALPTLVIIAMISFAVGALFNDAFFGFGSAYSVCDKDQMKTNA